MELDRAGRPVQDFVERHQNVRLDVLATLGEVPVARTVLPPLAGIAGAIATAKELLEEVAEAGAAEMEFRTVL